MAYLHLLSNHFPILGSLFGVLLLVVALVKPNLNTTLSAYLILLLGGIGGFVAYFTGEPAEESVEHVPGISHKLIHVHEEMAENALIFVFLLTAAAVVGLWAERAQWKNAKNVERFTLVVGIIAFILFAFTGYLGGHIRHMAHKQETKQNRYDKAYLRLAASWALLSHCQRKQVGAIIVKDAIIISDGYNGTPAGFDNCCEDDNNQTHWYVLHAEANAILKVARSTNNCKDATLYLTHSPCKDCSKLVLQSGIKRLVYQEAYKDLSGVEFLKSAGLEVTQIENIDDV